MAAATLRPGAVRSLSCPSCGAAVVLRGLAWTQTVACASCSAVLDARDPNLAVLQRAASRMRVEPLIPLGARGDWRGAPYEVIGFQQRTIRTPDGAWSWREYLLFNPYRGFRYLTEYDGHWTDVVPLQALPEVGGGAHAAAAYEGRAYKHFQTARAETTFVLGEFPWEVRVGDVAEARDYVAPPHGLSAESTDDETTWSKATYVDAAEIWRAFKVEGRPPSPQGVYSTQPNPLAARARARWAAFAVLAALLMLTLFGRAVLSANREVFSRQYVYRGTTVPDAPAAPGAAFVTPTFELPGGPSNVVVETEASVDNQWLFVEYALIDEATGQAYDFGREVSYYSGRDSDGNWTEGSKRDRARIGAVPGGRWFLRVEPSGDAAGRSIAYTVRVRRDVPTLAYYLLALVALAVPPVVGTLRSASFETRRWAESDHAPSSDDDGGDDDE
ncbi:DUF4178 domain-containing protein [Roseisolibacter sp. H3M3-2]|uniref:DUF4178 domain-containing protein n=1 Tax=Roseisolibacter sp. H3M3-2 TaxID=3031323 RepID=UPI0023DAF952|nr:DUF4178 domain-containing protein [Roseisolibacter sp. H3M3-2]MDF1503354.1 DUF4178 domain-containing protein [Roseisolibacter sp. H3M3-2]